MIVSISAMAYADTVTGHAGHVPCIKPKTKENFLKIFAKTFGN